MKGVISWFARNGVAANLLMAFILLAGLYTLKQRLILEVFPEFEQDVVIIKVPYRGATPAEVEEGVVVRIEEAIQDLVGIEEITFNRLFFNHSFFIICPKSKSVSGQKRN